MSPLMDALGTSIELPTTDLNNRKKGNHHSSYHFLKTKIKTSCVEFLRRIENDVSFYFSEFQSKSQRDVLKDNHLFYFLLILSLTPPTTKFVIVFFGRSVSVYSIQ